MISAITGMPGHGKSYHAAERMMLCLKNGLPIVTNIEIYPDIMLNELKRRGYEVPPENIILWDMTKDLVEQIPLNQNAEIFMDEVMKHFNSRTWNDKSLGRQRFLDFLTQHRHYDTNCWFLCQHLGQIDKQIRQLCDTIYSVIDLSKQTLPIIGGRIGLPITLIREFDGTTQSLRALKTVYRNKSIFRLYNTKQKGGGISMFESKVKTGVVKINKKRRFIYELTGL